MKVIAKYVTDIDGIIQSTQIYIDGKSVKLGDLLAIDDTDISGEFAKQSARYAYVGMQAAKAESAYEEAKSQAELVKANIDHEIRTDRAYINKKPTETAIQQMVVESEEYQDASELERGRYRDWKILRAMTEALRQRGDMLVSLGAQLRQEWDQTDLHMGAFKEKLRGDK